MQLDLADVVSMGGETHYGKPEQDFVKSYRARAR
jgi:hypothetical protein